MDHPPAGHGALWTVGVVAERTEPGSWESAVLDRLEGCPELDVRWVGHAVPAAGQAGGRARSALVKRVKRALDRSADALASAFVPGDPAAEGHDQDDLDLLVDLTRAGSRPGVPLHPARRTWWFRFGPSRDAGPAEAVADAALAGATTIDVTLESSEGVVRAGTFGISPFAPWSSAAAAAESFTSWPAWAAASVARGDGWVLPHAAMPAFTGGVRPVASGAPGRLAPARLAARATRDLARRALWAEVWTVGLAPTTPAQVLAAGGLPEVTWLGERGPSGLRSLVEPQAFAADPFLYADGDRAVCLFEALDYDSNRGWIAAVDVPPGTSATRQVQRTVFQNEWHWSYPFVLVDGGETYCIPETADAGGVLLHRLTDAGFEQEADLLPGWPVLDPSIVRHEGRYWLFCTLRDGPLLNTALHLFVADRLTGPYRPHRHNPVKIDVRSARPAGTIFAIDGVLHRPGQDCGAEYGAALVIHRIDALSEDEFRETPVAVLRPRAPYGAGLHTLSFGAGWAAIDAKRHAFSPRLLGAQVSKVLRRRS